jgi:N-acetylglutamate synthase-like GNAT family acetyltransferase
MTFMHFEVRVARPEDAEGVGKLLQASYPELMASAYEAQSLALALTFMIRANPSLLGSGTYYVAEDAAGLVVGCGGWTRERPGTKTVEPRLGHLRHFGTHPAWVRRGVGKAIYGACEAAARAAGVSTFEAYSSLNAEKFYRALGFERIREMDIEFDPQVVLRAVLMRREI